MLLDDRPVILTDGPDPSVPDRWLIPGQRDMSYEVRFAPHLLAAPRPIPPPCGGDGAFLPLPRRALVIVDANLHKPWDSRLKALVAAQPFPCTVKYIHVDEAHKDEHSLFHVLDLIDAAKLDRRDVIIGVGGGVLLDIVGLAASLYRRATPYWRIPSTLLGIVDASVGSKTGVNYNGKKNLIGGYYPPQLTLIDPAFLATLHRQHISNGLSEVLKMALVRHPQLFEIVSTYARLLLDEGCRGTTPAGRYAAIRVLSWAIDAMLRELAPNLCETELDRAVDYGHWLSPPLEIAALPDLLHGQAVAIDMAFTALLSLRRGLLYVQDVARILDTIAALELPLWHPLLTVPFLVDALAGTTRHRDGEQHFPLLQGIGRVKFVDNIKLFELEWALNRLRREAIKRAAVQ